MGQKLTTEVFQFISEVHITLGSGVLGVLFLLKNKMHTRLIKTLISVGLSYVSYRYLFSNKKCKKITKNQVVFITGCDSGLGFSLALHAYELGFTVFAGCLNQRSEGAIELSKLGRDLYILEVDITKDESVKRTLRQVEEYLINKPEKVLWALINNAGVMVFGEFEWQTDRLIHHQISVNLFGTMRITKAFLPLLRKHTGRILTVSSHCAQETLPGLSTYGATKSGLSAWSDGLRVELNKYGVKVTELIPGSFVTQSNIMSRLNDFVFEMENSMNEEQLDFYGEYFKEYYSYLSGLPTIKTPRKIEDKNLYDNFENALLDDSPKKCYINEPWRYSIYHTLFKYSPTFIRDYLVVQFVQMPQWGAERKIQHVSETVCMVD